MGPPDILVLAAGGVLGEAWMSGVLAGIEDAAGFDLRETAGFVGTSAGSIVAARLAAGRSPRRPGDGAPASIADEARHPPDEPGDATGAVFATAAAPFAPLAMRLREAAGPFVRSAALRAFPDGTRTMDELRHRVAGWDASFDGRLRVCALDRDSGRRAVFGAPGAPPATVAQAVEASCAIPGSFAPVRIAGRAYVDGGAWSVTNLDAAPARRGDHILCLDPSANPQTSWHSAMGLFRAGAGAITALEIAALARRGVTVRRVGPGRDAGRLMAPSLMDPGPGADVHAAAYRQGRAIAAAA